MGLRDLFRRQPAQDKPAPGLPDNARRHLDPSTLADPIRAGFTADEVQQALDGAAVPESDLELSFADYFTEAEQQPGEPAEVETTTPADDPRWARAVELRDEFNRAMTLENTPAAFATDEYDYSDDVWCDEIYSTPGSVAIEKELDAHVRAHPDLFAGTEFEAFAHEEPEQGEDDDRPPEPEEIDDGLRMFDPTHAAADDLGGRPLTAAEWQTLTEQVQRDQPAQQEPETPEEEIEEPDFPF